MDEAADALSAASTQALQDSPSGRGLLTFTVLLSAFCAAMSAVIMNIGLPAIIDALGARQATAHWLITGFTSSGTLSMLLASWSARRFGLRRTFMSTLVVFILGCAACGLSTSLAVLIASRIVQGMASGLITTLGVVALSAAYPEQQRGRAMAVFGMGVVLAPMLGPAVGGLLMQVWGWRGLMWMPLPFCLVALWSARIALPAYDRQTVASAPFDWGGFVRLTGTLCLLLGGMTQLQLNGWPPAWTLAWGSALLALGISLVRQELRCGMPLVDLRHFRVLPFAAAGCVSFVYGFGVWGSAYVLPMFLQVVGARSPLETGLILLPGGLVMLLMIPVAGRMADAPAPQWVVAGGLLCFAVAFTGLALVADVGTASTLLIAALITFGRGLGLGMVIPALDATASRTLPLAALAEGLALMNFLRQLGGALSPGLLALVLEARVTVREQPGVSHEWARALGYQDTLMVLGVLFVIAAVPAWKMRPHR
ncbi:DHA2 family efflux MFS transporter permease subunit [Pseudomonas baltica]|uniref:DHA2 family efflux MFS transporter permease subunit n=1 Tax=Pseudomonas baltica TaxID=2762576 RepID=UPI002898FF2B|nr:DHA2 family efflux MFS transporter permease subunit [Pseudomonas baltica]